MGSIVTKVGSIHIRTRIGERIPAILLKGLLSLQLLLVAALERLSSAEVAFEARIPVCLSGGEPLELSAVLVALSKDELRSLGGVVLAAASPAALLVALLVGYSPPSLVRPRPSAPPPGCPWP